MPTSLLKLGITGVQEFISAAQKVRDSATASALITHLMQHVIAVAQGRPELKRYLPHEAQVCSHQVTFAVDGGIDAARTAAVALSEAFQQKWRELAEQCRRGNEEEWDRQIRGAFRPLWAAVPVQAADAESSFEQLQDLYDARKATRDFDQNPTSSTPGGCPLCGKRDTVAERKRDDQRLCAVCFVKRATDSATVGGPDRIPSTRLLAAASFVSSDLGRKALKELREWVEDYGGLTVRDLGAQDFESLLLDDDPLPEEVDAQLRGQIKELRATAHRATRRHNYYAVLMFDGDCMGEWFSGDEARRSPEHDHATHLHYVGTAVTKFVTAFRAMELPNAALRAYVGGDDGLLFLPRDRALDVAATIHGVFVDAMRDLRSGGPTLSMSLTIAHQSYPLQDVLTYGRWALEDVAKKQLRRNALAVSVIFGTGARVTGGSQWGVWGPGVVEWLRACVDAATSGSIARSFWYELLDEAGVCFVPSLGGYVLGKPDGYPMLNWLLNRLWRQHGSGDEAVRSAVTAGILELARQPATQLFDPLANLQALVKIIDFLARRSDVR